MLEPGGSSTNPVSSTKKNDKKTESPDIVTLSVSTLHQINRIVCLIKPFTKMISLYCVQSDED